jgi:hypothetical protein
MLKAWIKEWAKVPQEVINNFILHLDDLCQKIINNGGNNNFHG